MAERYCGENLVFRVGQRTLINDVSLTLSQGEMVALIGPNGAGKSTLMKCLIGIYRPDKGAIRVKGEPVQFQDTMDALRSGISMIHQELNLVPHMTVAENMGYGLKVNKVPKDEIRRQVEMVAKTLQLSHLLDRKPKQLSGGQRQRVAIGRTLVAEPRVFLLDEPLSNLDAALRVQMRIEISRLHKRLGRTMIYVTHDQDRKSVV